MQHKPNKKEQTIKLLKKYVLYQVALFSLVFFSCNRDEEKSEMAKDLNKYYQTYGKDLEDITNWCSVNIKTDTNYEISRDRSPKLFYNYLTDDSIKGSHFEPLNLTPQKFANLSWDASIMLIQKWKREDYYKFYLGPIYRTDYFTTVLILKNENGKILQESEFANYKPYSIDRFLNNNVDNFIDKRSERFYFLIEKHK